MNLLCRFPKAAAAIGCLGPPALPSPWAVSPGPRPASAPPSGPGASFSIEMLRRWWLQRLATPRSSPRRLGATAFGRQLAARAERAASIFGTRLPNTLRLGLQHPMHADPAHIGVEPAPVMSATWPDRSWIWPSASKGRAPAFWPRRDGRFVYLATATAASTAKSADRLATPVSGWPEPTLTR